MKLFLLLAAMVVVLQLQSCSRYYYAPHSHNVPLLTQRGDLHISGNLYSAYEIEAVEIQTAVAVSDNIGIMVNTFAVNQSVRIEQPGVGKGHLIEAGVGRFRKMTSGDRMILETYGGLGHGVVFSGYVENANPQYNPGFNLGYSKSRLAFLKLFVQPAIGYKGRVLEAVLSMRIAALDYYRADFTGALPDRDFQAVMDIKSKAPLFAAEPAFTLRLGARYFKLQAQIGTSWTAEDVGNAGMYLSGGLVIRVPAGKEE